MVYLYNPEHNVPVWNFLFFNLKKKKNKTKWRASCLKEKLLKRPGIPYMKWRASPPFWGDCMRWRFNLPPSWQMQSCRVSSFYRLFLFPPPPPPCQFKHFLFPRTTGYTIYVLILVSGILPSARLYSNSKRIVSLFFFSFLFSYLHLIIVLNLFAIRRQRCCKKRGPF